jgi:SAM-dependent methyltransferase
MGAEVTGVDLSDRAIEEAKKLAKRCEAKVEFICSDLYELQENHESMYDMLFTTYGTIGWLPDLAEWADVVAHFLRPGGRLVFVDFHPFIWMYDQNFETIEYSYFKSEPIIEEFEGSYASEHVEKARSISWNHGISEVFQALNNSGLHISEFREYDYSPYRIFNEMYERSEREFLLSKFGNKLPLVYSILAEKY